MDAFFASVEQRENPSLIGQPLVVGGRSGRGVVAAASYEARTFGIRSAMSMREALSRCPDVHVVAPRHKFYSEVSREIFEVFRRYTPLVEGISLDEAFLDVTGSQKLFGTAVGIAQRIKAEITQETQLVASAGVAPSKLVAKIASDLDKPDGLVVVRPDEVRSFLAPLPIERMWGVGKVASAGLRGVGIETLGALSRAPLSVLSPVLGQNAANVQARARGEDNREVVTGSAPKSLGAESTFETDINEVALLRRYLLRHAREVARRLNHKDLDGRVVTLKIKYNDFKVRTLRRTLSNSVSDTDSIYEVVCELLNQVDLSVRPLRLIGLSVSDFVRSSQMTLFEAPQNDKRLKIQDLSDSIANRFGDAGLTRASLLGGLAKKTPPDKNR
ncbi:MAG: DNA polymerase IV [Deltaproteobacteria bacterium]|nr:DNA polymerase IV [Deltaproteobacteria bacterium]MBT6435767.1 DNA polymerase IV [Deltaproteobacteria bacterium]MBT6490483.1 DNA polymerase IV [Deltaproteobacteria bacterium]